MTTTHDEELNSGMRLYSHENRRLYINASERLRFVAVANRQTPQVRAFCLTLFYTGCRLSEARELTIGSVQADERLLSVRSLKKRNQHHTREIPIPQALVEIIMTLPEESFWAVNRITAYRWVKQVMKEASISGPQASPKGLRHGYGIHAVRSGIQLNMLQKWMGHASIKNHGDLCQRGWPRRNGIGCQDVDLVLRSEGPVGFCTTSIRFL